MSNLVEATESFKVYTSGCCLSFLLQDNMRCPYFQEGFLIGEMEETTFDKITDNDRPVVNIARAVRIQTSLPCPSTGYFYNGQGKVDFKKLQFFLGDLTPQVVGYFKYKPLVHNHNLTLTLREVLIHKQLASFLTLPEDCFISCFLGMSHSENHCTYFHHQTVYRHHKNRFEPIKLMITNLSRSRFDEYEVSVQKPLSKSMEGLVKEVKSETKNLSGFEAILTLQEVLDKHIDNITDSIIKEERELFRLEMEVSDSDLVDSTIISKDVAQKEVVMKEMEVEEEDDEE